MAHKLYTFSKENKYYKSQHAELLKHHKDQFVVLKEDKIIGSYTTEPEAYQAGLNELGNVPFLIKQIREDARDIDLAPALVLGLIDANI